MTEKKWARSIRAKGTFIAIGIMFFSCFASFTLMTIIFMSFYDDTMSIGEAHAVFGNFMAATLVICVAWGSLLLYLAIKKISDPIIRISDAAGAVARGDFSVKVAYKSNDEIGVLAHNFNLMTAELGNMEYLRKDFISNVSHELKTPVASIKGFAEMLQEQNLAAEDFQAYLGIIIDETQRLSHLSSNMLRLSRLDHQLILERSSTFSLDEQIRRTLVLLEEKWSAKNLELELELEKIAYAGDEELIQQIWLNLLENAIKFSPEYATITVRAKKAPRDTVVQIQDQGLGIAENDQARIFERFFQVDKAHSQEGSGLGLAITKKIVEIHQGEISFISDPGRGTCFTIRLPWENETPRGTVRS